MKTFRWRSGFLAFAFLISSGFSVYGQQSDSGRAWRHGAQAPQRHHQRVKMTDADTRSCSSPWIGSSLSAAEDTGMPKHAAVKRRLVSKADVEKYATGQLAKE